MVYVHEMVISATVKIVKARIVKIDIISNRGKSDALHHLRFDAVLPASRGCIKKIGEFSENGSVLSIIQPNFSHYGVSVVKYNFKQCCC